MAGHLFIAVVGARELPQGWAPQVTELVGFFVARSWGIGSGGARGADQFALEAVVAAGATACARSAVFLPGAHSAPPGGALGALVARGGRVVAGSGVGRAALLARSRRLVGASAGVVAFLWGPSRGSVFTVREAIRSGKPAAVVLARGGAALPSFGGGCWAPCALGSVAAFRWVPAAGTAETEDGEPKRTALHRIFVVPDGEPVDVLMTDISRLSAGERLWFELGVLAGDTVLSPTRRCPTRRPSSRCLGCAGGSGAPRAKRRGWPSCSLFLALDAGPELVAHYEREARRRAVAAIVEDLGHLVTRLALVEQTESGDALEDAQRLGDEVETVTTDGRVAQSAVHLDGEGALLGWHALGVCAIGEGHVPWLRGSLRGRGRVARGSGVPRVWRTEHLGEPAGRRVSRARR